MTGVRALRTDERGLVGKIIVLWIALGVVLALGAVDAAKIVLARVKVSDAAQTAAFDASRTYRTTRGDRKASYEAALEAVEEADPDAKITEFVIEPTPGRVTVTVTRRLSTLLVGRFGLLKDLARVTATESSQPGGL